MKLVIEETAPNPKLTLSDLKVGHVAKVIARNNAHDYFVVGDFVLRISPDMVLNLRTFVYAGATSLAADGIAILPVKATLKVEDAA